MRTAIILTVVIAGAAAGFFTGKKAAQHRAEAEISRSVRQNGIWTYFEFGEKSKPSEFLLATQCISGGSAGQTLYFISTTDSEGKPLATGNDYQLDGSDLPCGSWSIAAYDGKKLLASGGNRSFLSKSSVEFLAENRWEAFIAREKKGEHYISSGSGSGEMTVVLRVHNPAPELIESIDLIELPTITKI